MTIVMFLVLLLVLLFIPTTHYLYPFLLFLFLCSSSDDSSDRPDPESRTGRSPELKDEVSKEVKKAFGLFGAF